MRVVFGIDVSKASSEVAILVNGENTWLYHTNDAIGFNRLLEDLGDCLPTNCISGRRLIVYSRRLQAFFEDNSYAYIRLNPLESQKQLDNCGA